MDTSWYAFGLDSARTVQVLRHPTATTVELVTGTSSDEIDITAFVSQIRQTNQEVSLTLTWHSELYGTDQPTPGELLEVKMNGRFLWWGIIDSLSSYNLNRGQRQVQLIARSRDAGPLWREAKRVTDLYPVATPLHYIANQVAVDAGLDLLEMALPTTAAYTVHSNTQMADISAWQMVTLLYQPMGYEPFVDAHGRLKAISRDLTRPSDYVLQAERIVSINSSKNLSPVTLVRIRWLDPNLVKVSQQGQSLGQFNITAGFFQLNQNQDVFFSSDRTQRAENTYMVIKQSCNSGLLEVADETYTQFDLYQGQINLRTHAWVPTLAGGMLGTMMASEYIGDLIPVTAYTIPWGKVIHAIAEGALLIIMMSIGTGSYEIWGTPYEFVHQRNQTQAYDQNAPVWLQNEQEIENDFVMDESMAQAFAVRELIYQNKAVQTYNITIVDDPRIEPGDIIELYDASKLYVTGYSRDLMRGGKPTLDVTGFRIV